MNTAQQIYQQIQSLPLPERLQLIRQLFAETVKAERFQLAGSMMVQGDPDEIIKAQRAAIRKTLQQKAEQLRTELADQEI